MLKESEKAAVSTIFEGMTSISAVLERNDCNNRRVERILIDRDRVKNKRAEIGFLVAKSHEYGFPIEYADASEIDALAVGSTHGGILAVCSDRTIPILTSDAIRPGGFYVYADGIEDPYNFGYTVRSLYAAGVDGMVLPPRNWMSAAGVVARASAGTSEKMPLFAAEAEDVLSLFKSAGYTVLCAGIRDSVSLFDTRFSYPILLVVGGEKRGISRTLLDGADAVVRIDYGREFRGSLSAASAAAVMAFELYRQNRS